MRKYLCCYLLILGVLLGCSGCTVGNDHRIIQEISNRLDTDIANGKIVINEDSHSGFLNDGTSIIAIQFSDNGYYFLYDRQAKNGRAAGADILRRDSLNFTVAVYDSDSRILYYCEMDT